MCDKIEYDTDYPFRPKKQRDWATKIILIKTISLTNSFGDSFSWQVIFLQVKSQIIFQQVKSQVSYFSKAASRAMSQVISIRAKSQVKKENVTWDNKSAVLTHIVRVESNCESCYGPNMKIHKSKYSSNISRMAQINLFGQYECLPLTAILDCHTIQHWKSFHSEIQMQGVPIRRWEHVRWLGRQWGVLLTNKLC